MALTSDGKVQVSGSCSSGQCSVPADLSNVVAIAAGDWHCLALRSDGVVVGWGTNSYGQATPPAGLSNVVQVAAGSVHSLALQSNGRVVAWGSSLRGQTNVPADCTNIVEVATGAWHNLALRRDGTVLAWASNSFNQVVTVPTGLSGVVHLAAGGDHNLALKADGTVTAWGDRSYGLTNVPAGLSNVIAIAAGLGHNLALKADTTVVAWGKDFYGQTDVPAGLSSVGAISAGRDNSVAIVYDGPPWVAIQPQDQTTFTGTEAVFSATVLGTPPLAWQWQCNSTNLSWGTNAQLMLTDLRLSDAGPYSLLVSNRFGATFSSNAVLTVVTGPPTFLVHPADLTCLPGSNAFFSARATGSEPISYCWQFNGANLEAPTNWWLTLPQVQLTNEGYYRLVASNAFGSATSSNAFLSIADLGGALNARHLLWTNLGPALWVPETAVSHDGSAAASASPLGSFQSASLQTLAAGPCTLSFWWRMDVGGILSFDIDGGYGLQQGASFPWQQKTYYLDEGTHTLTWTFTSSFSGTAFLDQVNYMPGGSPPVLITAPSNQTVAAGTNATFSVAVEGHTPITYQWQFQGANITGATASSLTVTNVQSGNAGLYQVTATNPYGATNASATLSVTPSKPGIWIHPTNQQAVMGGICVFSVLATGSEPAYQWQFNGNPIPSATNSRLVLAGVNTAHLGNYNVVVSNALGTAVSSNATLTLLASRLVAWGQNVWGQCKVPATLSNVTAFAAGYGYSAAVDGTGKIVNWGWPSGFFSPAPTGVVALAAGSGLLALKADHTVAASTGLLTLPSGLSNLVAVAAGSGFCAALRDDGTVVAWGSNTYGQTNVPPGLFNVVAISCGPSHCLALRRDGTLLAWGDNNLGATNIPAEATNILAVAAGRYHNLALRADGTVLEWGDTNSVSPSLPNTLTNVVAIAAGYKHSLALRSDGALVAWADNTYGQTNLPDVATNVMVISAGDYHCLALLGDGSPSLTRPLWNQTAMAGSSLIFNASAVGNAPLSYQWQRDGINLAGVTNALLVLTNLPVTSAGTYRCQITNAFGSVTTTNLILTVTRQPLRFAVQPGAPGYASDGLHLRLVNLAGAGPVSIEASSDLQHWQTILLHPAVVGSLDFTDAEATGLSRRFYRASENAAGTH